MIKKITLVIALGILAVAAKDAPIEHPDCPLNGDPFNPVHLPYPNDCTKFYKCNGKIAHQMDCQPGLHWNNQAQYCDYPNNARCDPTAPQPNPGGGVIVGHPDCDPNEDPANPTHLPMPNDCTKFYKCDRGNAHPINCPNNLHWNAQKDYCDYPGLAKCDPSIALVKSAPEQHSGCQNPNEDPMNPTLLPFPGDCQKFYICNGGIAIEMDCPSGLHWDESQKRCNWPLSAGCRQ
ncbi:hypothetical protein ACFFRR_011459 [Megaselia abdita]